MVKDRNSKMYQTQRGGDLEEGRVRKVRMGRKMEVDGEKDAVEGFFFFDEGVSEGS